MPTEDALVADRIRQHGLVFEDPAVTLEAVKTLRKEGFEVADVHSPFPIHGIDEAIGLPPTRLPWATFAGGSVGLLVALALQTWTHAADWPLNIGGKSNIAMPALVPVAFELTVLIAAFATVGTLLFRSRLFPTTKTSLPKTQPIEGVSDNLFVILVVERDGSFSAELFDELCQQLQVKQVLRNRRPA